MKFLLAVIETFSKNLKISKTERNFRKFFAASGRASRTIEATSPPPPRGVQANVILYYSVEPTPVAVATVGVAILVTIQAVVPMVTVPVAMVTACVAMETGAFCITSPSSDHLTRDPRDRALVTCSG